MYLANGLYPFFLCFSKFCVNYGIDNAAGTFYWFLNTKFGEAQEKGIKTICQIHIPIPEELELDFSIILFNLLDNAIAYEEQGIENAQISVSITKTAGYLRNSCKK